MKLMRTAVLLLTVLLLVPVLAACGNPTTDPVNTGDPAASTASSDQSGDPGDATTDEAGDGFEPDALPEKLNLDKTLTMLYDLKFSTQEFFAEDTNGEAVNDAIFRRNANVENRLGLTVKYEGCEGNDKNQDKFLKKAQSDVAAGTPEYDIYAAYSRTIPYLAVNGLCGNLLDTEYFNVSKPWWPQALTDECTIKGKLLFATGDISTNLLWYMSGAFFNQEMWEAARMGYTLYDLVDNNEWVLDKFIEICKQFVSGETEADRIYGMVAYNACLDAFLNSCGVISIDKDADGNLKLSDDFLGERTANIVAKLGTFFNEGYNYHTSSTSADEKAIFYERRSLFVIDGTQIVRNVGTKIEFDYGLVPLPKYDSDQARFVTNLRYPYNFYAINKTSENQEESGTLLEALASESYRSVTPVLFELTMKTRYSQDSTTSRMYDILRGGIAFDLGRLFNYSIGNFYPQFRNQCIAGGNWSSNAQTIRKSTTRLIDALMPTFDD